MRPYNPERTPRPLLPSERRHMRLMREAVFPYLLAWGAIILIAIIVFN